MNRLCKSFCGTILCVYWQKSTNNLLPVYETNLGLASHTMIRIHIQTRNVQHFFMYYHQAEKTR